MTLSTEQIRKLEALVAELAPTIHEPMVGLVKEFAQDTMNTQFGRVWDVAEIHAAETRVFTQMELEVAKQLTTRLVARLLNPHASV